MEIFRSLADLFWETKPLGKLRGSKSKGLYGCLQKIVVLYPQIIHFNRVFHYFHHPFWGTTSFGNTHIYIYIYRGGNPTVKGFQGFYLTVYIYIRAKDYGRDGRRIFFLQQYHPFFGIFECSPVVLRTNIFFFSAPSPQKLTYPKKKINGWFK